MPLSLPPVRLIRHDEATAALVHAALTSVIAGHPQATQTYTFYEEIDQWLGPWGDKGYPIAYGKFYNVAFTSNKKLMGNPTTQDWVWKTTILLQEALRDYLVKRLRDGTLGGITEPELRKAAFDSHPIAYTDGGLAKVVAVAPELLPIITLIPAKEFSPLSSNFKGTIAQVFTTIGLVLPRTAGYVLPAMAGPAHTGLFRIAMHRDEQREARLRQLGSSLAMLKAAINGGEADDIPTLRSIAARLNATEFPDQVLAHEARAVILAAQARQATLQNYYRGLLRQSPEMNERFQARFRWLLTQPSP